MTPEGRVKDYVKRVLRYLGAWYFMPVQTGRGVGGVPDILACVGGRFVGIETKAKGGRLTVRQALQLETLQQAGGLAVVVDPDTLELWEIWIRGVANGTETEPPSPLVDPIFERLRLARQGR